MVITEKYTLDIDDELYIADRIFSKYITLPEDLIFIKGMRYSIIDRSELLKFTRLGLVNNQPFHPIISVSVVCNMIRVFIQDNNPYKNLLFNNTLMESGGTVYGIPDAELEDLLLEYNNGLSWDKEDIKLLEKILSVIYDKVETLLNNSNVSKVVNINYDTSDIIIEFGEDIRAIRYEELLNNHIEEENYDYVGEEDGSI